MGPALGNDIEIVGLSPPMNKSGRLTYLSQGKELLIFASANIEGDHGLPFDSHGISEQLQHIVKAVRGRRGDNNNNKKPPLKYFPRFNQSFD